MRSTWLAALRGLTVLCLGLATLGPMVWFCVQAFVPREAILRGWPRFSELTFANYSALAVRVPLPESIGNSTVLAFSSATMAVGLALPVAYFISRSAGKASWLLYSTALTLWLVPPIALSLEVYFWFLRLHLYDRLAGLVLLHGALNATLSIIVLTPYLDVVPRRLDEAAWVDGLKGFQVLWLVHWPILRGLLLGVFALAFIRSWNELLFATILTDLRVRNWSLAMLGLTTGSWIEWGQVAAFATLALLPVPVAMLLLAGLRTARRPGDRYGGGE